MKKIYILAPAVALTAILQSGKKNITVPPTGETGASGAYCTDCHNSFPLNSPGGSVVATGLPSGTFVAGQAYNFTIAITSPKTLAKPNWGFSIAAVNASGAGVGTFSTTNPNAALNPDVFNTPPVDELSHNNAVSAPGGSYTYKNLTWTAPKTPVATADKTVSFFYAAVAGNGDKRNSGDYVMSGTTMVTLPIHLVSFTAKANENGYVSLDWSTSAESNGNYFELQKSNDGQLFFPIGKFNASSNGANTQSYNLEDKNIAYYDVPAYYRLKLVDKDGSVRFSNVVTATVNSTKKNGFVKNVYPSLILSNRPITAVIESDKDQSLQISVCDASGRAIQKLTKSLVKGSNQVEFQLTNVPKGWVFAKFITANNQQTIPLLINKQ